MSEHKSFSIADSVRGAFNVFNLEGAVAVSRAVREEGRAAFLQTSASVVKAYGADVLGRVLRGVLGERNSDGILLHLDHCGDVALIRECLDAGWDCVMFDGSDLPLAENIRRTAEISRMAGEAGALTEGQIGYVGGPEDGHEGAAARERVLVEDAVRFYEDSGVDLLAVGVGTSHGHYAPGACRVDVDLLEEVSGRLPGVPMVLHGGSGIPDDQVADAVKRGGVRKINFSTGIKEAYLGAVREHLDSADPLNTGALVRSGISAIEEAVAERVRFFASLSL